MLHYFNRFCFAAFVSTVLLPILFAAYSIRVAAIIATKAGLKVWGWTDSFINTALDGASSLANRL